MGTGISRQAGTGAFRPRFIGQAGQTAPNDRLTPLNSAGTPLDMSLIDAEELAVVTSERRIEFKPIENMF